MFGFGNDSEHKLEENMEEIKNMVDDQAETEDLPDETDQWTRQDLQETDFSNKDFDMEEAEQLMENEPQPQKKEQKEEPEQEEKPLEEEIEKFEKNLEEENVREQRRQRKQQGGGSSREQSRAPRQEQEYREETGRRADSVKGNVRADIPEPAETKKLDVPDIDKGPLFIRQRKFERATQLIYDMKYLADEIEAIINTIEADLQRDEETENQLKEILGEFRDGRTEVERIVSVGEE